MQKNISGKKLALNLNLFIVSDFCNLCHRNKNIQNNISQISVGYDLLNTRGNFIFIS